MLTYDSGRPSQAQKRQDAPLSYECLGLRSALAQRCPRCLRLIVGTARAA